MMGIPGFSDNAGLYNLRSKPRAKQQTPQPHGPDKVNEALDQHHASKNGAGEQSRSSITRHKSHIPDISQYQQYANSESVNDTSFNREQGMSRATANAINAYQGMENQEKRDEIEKMLGLDLYV
jgi:hypothetical protein